MSNKDWKSPVDPDARIAKLKDGRTHLAHKPEHVVDLDSSAIVAVKIWGTSSQTYGPYAPDKSMLSLCLKNAAELWKHMAAYRTGGMGINEMPYAKGFHLLCDYCDWNADCTKFNEHEHQPEWDTYLQRLADLKESRSTFDAEIKEIEQGLKDAYNFSDAGGSATGTWINTGGHRFKVSQQPGKRTLNRDRLRLELMDSLGDEHAAEKLISWCEDEGKAFGRLSISPVKQSPVR